MIAVAMDQHEYDQLLTYKQTALLPKNLSKNNKDSLRRKAKPFVIKDGFLFFKDMKNARELQVYSIIIIQYYILL